jgi:transcriptional regulator with XRE-family HTH domain
MDIGLRIKYLRQQSKLSISKLAKGAGISQSFLSEVEAGTKNITVNKLQDICNFLGISINDFFSDNPIELSLRQRQVIQKLKLLKEDEIEIISKLINYFLANRKLG